MRILIVDDEAPARDELRFILGDVLPEASVAEAQSGDAALEMLSGPEQGADAVFLDIHMPGTDGLAVAAALLELPAPPLVVFATAYDAHAVRAFELAALDYVVKPFDERRLAETAERLRTALSSRGAQDQARAALEAFLSDRLQEPVSKPRLWGERENETRVLVKLADAQWIEARDKQVWLHSAGEEPLRLRDTLQALESRLEAHGFVRAHKSFLVNLDHVAEAVPWFAGTWKLRMRDPAQTEIPVSRRYASRIRQHPDWGW